MDTDNGFTVAYHQLPSGGDYDSYIRHFVYANGIPTGLAVRVNTTLAGDQILPIIITDGKGNLLVAWMSSSGTADIIGPPIQHC